MYTQKENFTKPGGYSRAQNDNLTFQQKLSYNSSTQINNPHVSIKGINSCYHCKETKIVYDENRDEIYCQACGTVLRQGFMDYETLILEIQEIGAVNYREQYNKSYYDDLLELYDYKIK